MTLGEKLKEARKQFGWSQEELADKLYVSRAAIAKWETDKGIPDTQNLIDISNLLQVSIDYLLDNDGAGVKYVSRESIDLSQFGKGIKKKKKDKAVRSIYPDAEIRTLLIDEKRRTWENVLNFFTLYIPKFVSGIKLMRFGEFYLVIQNDRQYIVRVADDYVESKELSFEVTQKTFEFDGYVFTDCGKIIYA